MKKVALLILLFSILLQPIWAYSVKVYDEWGNRIGTYRKEGDAFVLYDFYDKKIDNPQELLLRAPSQKSLKYYSEYFYDGAMNPIGEYTTGLWPQVNRIYPNGYFVPRYMYRGFGGRSMVCPRTHNRGAFRIPPVRSPRKEIQGTSNKHSGSPILYEQKYPYNSVKKY